MAYLNSEASDYLLAQVARKKQIIHAKKLFRIAVGAPAPSKDYLELQVTEGGVVYRMIPIRVRGVTQGAVPAPTEEVMTLDEFKVDGQFHDRVERDFGTYVLSQVKRVVGGNRDLFAILPNKVLLLIASLVGNTDLESLERLSLVNKHMQNICNSESLWEHLYRTHQGSPNKEVSNLASELGWRNVFYMNKIQLQKELSRRRKPAGSSHEPDKRHPSSFDTSTFLTDS